METNKSTINDLVLEIYNRSGIQLMNEIHLQKAKANKIRNFTIRLTSLIWTICIGVILYMLIVHYHDTNTDTFSLIINSCLITMAVFLFICVLTTFYESSITYKSVHDAIITETITTLNLLMLTDKIEFETSKTGEECAELVDVIVCSVSDILNRSFLIANKYID